LESGCEEKERREKLLASVVKSEEDRGCAYRRWRSKSENPTETEEGGTTKAPNGFDVKEEKTRGLISSFISEEER